VIRLAQSAAAWNTPVFDDTFKREAGGLDASSLPLQQGLERSSHVASSAFSLRVISKHDDTRLIHLRIGIFFCGVIAGCSCADDPTPMDELNEYCEARFTIDKQTAETRITLIEDD
jgi:hypothetical protein